MGDWITAFVGASALLAFLGTGTVFILSGRQKVRLAVLEDSNNDLRNDVADRDRRITFLEAENEAKTKTMKSLEAQVVALEKLKLGEAYFHALEESMSAKAEHLNMLVEANAADIKIVRGQNRDILALLADKRQKGNLT